MKHTDGYVSSFNVQGWVSAIKVAHVIGALEQQGMSVHSGSELIRVLLDVVHNSMCRDMPAIDTTTAINFITRRGLSIKQLSGDKRSVKYVQKAATQDESIVDSVAQIAAMSRILSQQPQQPVVKEVDTDIMDAVNRAYDSMERPTQISGDGPPVIYNDSVPDLSLP